MLKQTSLLITEPVSPGTPLAWGTQLDRLACKLTEASDVLALTIFNVEGAFKSLSPGMAADEATSASVTEAGANFTNKLLLYSEKLHPFACATLLNLESFLETFEDLSYTEFVQMVPLLVKEVPEYAGQAFLCKKLHEAYAEDLDALLTNVQRSLRNLELDVQAQQKRAAAPDDVDLACGLLGPAGCLLCAAPPVPRSASEGREEVAEEKRLRAVALKDEAATISAVRDKFQLGLPQAIHGMQDALCIVVDFFDSLDAELVKAGKQGPAHAAGAATSGLRTLYHAVRQRMESLVKACRMYRSTGQPLRIALRNIAQAKQRYKAGVVEEWLGEKLAAVQLEARQSGRNICTPTPSKFGRITSIQLR